MTAHSVLNMRAAPEWGNSELYNYYERNGLGYGTVHKKEKFIETMPMMIQTHLIICKDWAEVKDKAKSLEHIIQKCDSPTPTMPLMATDATVPGLYSHIAHSVDKEEDEIPTV